LDPSELLKNAKRENYPKSPVMDIKSSRLTLEAPSGEGFILGSTMDLRDVQKSDDLSIHVTESTQELDKVGLTYFTCIKVLASKIHITTFRRQCIMHCQKKTKHKEKFLCIHISNTTRQEVEFYYAFY